MSSNAYATPLTLELRTSRIAVSLLVLIHTLAIVSLFTLPWVAIIKALLFLILTFSLYKTLSKELRLFGNGITKIVWGRDNDWLLYAKDGEVRQAGLMASSFVHPLMTVLIFDAGERFNSISIMILPDNTEAESFRRLRVRLLLEKYNLLEQG